MPFNQQVMILVGLVFLLGLATDVLGRFARLPRVSLLILLGDLVGPDQIGLIPPLPEVWFETVSLVALVMVGFLLGERLTLAALKEQGPLVIKSSLAIALTTSVVVFLALWLFGTPLELALILAGIATATDPVATVDVIQQGRYQGRFPDLLARIVAIDDAWGLLIFSALLAFAVSLGGYQDGLQNIGHALHDIGGALAVGIALGLPMTLITGRISPGEPSQIEALGFVFLCAGITTAWHVSSLIAAMVMGMTVANLARHHKYPFSELKGIEYPFLVLFFVLAGASLDARSILSMGAIGLIYVASRIIGRAIGGRIGTRPGELTVSQRRWLGMALLPQAGVAIGMALVGAAQFPQHRHILITVAVATTVLFELLGPILLSRALHLTHTEQSPDKP